MKTRRSSSPLLFFSETTADFSKLNVVDLVINFRGATHVSVDMANSRDEEEKYMIFAWTVGMCGPYLPTAKKYIFRWNFLVNF